MPRGKSSKIPIMTASRGSSSMMLTLSAWIQPWESYQKRVNFASIVGGQHEKKMCRSRQLLTFEQDGHTMGDVHGMSKTLYSIKRGHSQPWEFIWHARGHREFKKYP